MKKNILLLIIFFIYLSNNAYGAIAERIEIFSPYCNSPEWYQEPIILLSWLIIICLLLSFYLNTEYLSNIKIKNNILKIIFLIILFILVNDIIIHWILTYFS